LSRLAQITSLIVLVIFAIVNLACMRVKLKDPHPKDVQTFPFVIPFLGFCSIVLFVTYRIWIYFGG
ncbi:TPA: hypothetical protein DE059_01435, partial [Candidatus Peribacteria bacterium]|nr:hypothetical protein [Candidatus Peribacteria bacterium]